MKVLVAPDKFKGSMRASDVAAHVAAGIRAGAPGTEVLAVPVADGGDGTLDAAVAAGFHLVPVTAAGPTGQPVSTGYARQDRTAVVELADACGLVRLPGGVLAPLTASSVGVGQVIAAALDAGCRRLVLAIGGSASTDGGAGMLTALGARILDADGQPVPDGGGGLEHVAAVDLTGLHSALAETDVVLASDVDNPLLGDHGAAAVYGPQKGATPDDVADLDAGLRHLVDHLTVLRSDAATLAQEPGAGAAGGLGFAGLLLGGRIVSGADYFLDLLDFDRRVADCDVVITGEGRIDDQTLHGKLPAVVARRSLPRPVIAVVGRSDISAAAADEMGLTAVHALTDHTEQNPAGDPQLSRSLLTELARTIPLAAERSVPSV